MRPEEYYKKELIKKCNNVIDEIKQNKEDYYKLSINELFEHVLPTCKMDFGEMKFDDNTKTEFKYETSKYIKSRKSVQHIFFFNNTKIKGIDKFIFYPEISKKDNDVVTFKAEYIEEQSLVIKKNIHNVVKEYRKKIEKYRDIKKSLQYDFDKEKIPELYQLFRENKVGESGPEEKEFFDLLEKCETDMKEYDESLKEYDESLQEYDMSEMSPDYTESYDGGGGSFDEMEIMEDAESPQFSEMVCGDISEYNHSISDVEMETTNKDKKIEMLEVGFTEKVNRAIEKCDDVKRKRYGGFPFFNVG